MTRSTTDIKIDSIHDVIKMTRSTPDIKINSIHDVMKETRSCTGTQVVFNTQKKNWLTVRSDTKDPRCRL